MLLEGEQHVLSSPDFKERLTTFYLFIPKFSVYIKGQNYYSCYYPRTRTAKLQLHSPAGHQPCSSVCYTNALAAEILVNKKLRRSWDKPSHYYKRQISKSTFCRSKEVGAGMGLSGWVCLTRTRHPEFDP